MRALGPGALLGAWLIEERRGRGGFAEVFRARHTRDARLAALKVLGGEQAGSPQLVRRFEQEAEVLAGLAHPGIPAILDRGVATDGRPWLAMEWIDGPDLQSELARRGRLPLGEALALLGAVAEALGAAHDAGVVHRDLKPANVLLERGRARLVDFGIAKSIGARAAIVHTTDTVLGTPRNMAPEQLRGGAIDARTDVYAFGLLAFELLTGRPAFLGDEPAELEAQHLGAPPPRASEHAPVPVGLDQPILRCLAKDPADRPASIADAMRALLAPAAVAPVLAVAAPGVLVEVHGPDDPDDAALDAIDAALDRARAACTAAGLSIVLASSSTLLASAAPAADLAAIIAALAARLAAPAGATTTTVSITVRRHDP